MSIRVNNRKWICSKQYFQCSK